MYAAKLRQKPEYRDLKRATDQIHKQRDMQLHQLENVKKELEMRHAKSNSILLRKKLMDHQNKLNYTNEIDRIRGHLSQIDPRFTSTREASKNRKEELIKLGGKIINKIEDYCNLLIK